MTRLRSGAFALLAGSVLLFAVSGPARATTILGPSTPLSDLLGGGGLVVDGLVFSMFGYSQTGEMPPPENINIIPIMDDNGYYGIRIAGAFLDTSFSEGASDAQVQFKVERNQDYCKRMQTACRITDVHLAGNPNLLGESVGSMSVTETIDYANTLEIFDDSNAGTQLTDWTYVEPTTQLSLVLKDILGYAVQGTATLSVIDQTFSVPEPGTLLLLGFGLSGLLVAGRRR